MNTKKSRTGSFPGAAFFRAGAAPLFATALAERLSLRGFEVEYAMKAGDTLVLAEKSAYDISILNKNIPAPLNFLPPSGKAYGRYAKKRTYLFFGLTCQGMLSCHGQPQKLLLEGGYHV